MTPWEEDEERAAGVVGYATAQLGHTRELLGMLSDAQYVCRPHEAGSCVAGHVRHCVDHYTAILAGAGGGTVDYDRRKRGGVLETDRSAALARLADVSARVAAVTPADLDRPVDVLSVVDAAGTVVRTRSTVGRELLFVAHHAVHHLAVMVPVARALGVAVPVEFGYAPATLAYLRRA
ncbi:DinB family protein [Streptomyces abikoensis]|uniref:DinB family protein n=1 Tax=Streptomyces abikoensis TaxID=97398 RepID=UPI00167B770E|nr:DinB family protein [Streptomyces abikoensis]GGP43703.1 hypothetical protein GCM10010214_15680 [Streptomyces abikoensis]